MSKEIDFSKLGSFFNSHLIERNFFFPYIVVIKINASIPNKTPLKPMAKDIGSPKTKISKHQQINAWRGIINATKAKKK